MAIPATGLALLAWRNLWRNYRRTLIMLLAITVGVWAMIFMTALLRGMVDNMVRQGINSLPGHVQVHALGFRDDPSVTHRLPAPSHALIELLNGDSVVAWSGRVKVPAVISSEHDNRGITLLGVDPEGEIALGFEPGSVTQGRFLDSISDHGIVIGRKLRDLLETRLGKRVVVMSQDPDNAIAERGFRVVGVYEAELESREAHIVYAGRAIVQELLGVGTDLSEIAVLGNDYRKPERLASAISDKLPAGHEALSWLSLDPYLSAMMKVMDGFVLVWIVVIFLALSFGLINTLMMAVFERVREIGLMRALGMRPSAIVYQILFESLMLLVLGLLLGNGLGISIALWLKDGIDVSVVSKGLEMMGASSVMYPVVQLQDLLLANSVVIVLGIIASLLPAWHAAQYQPVEALRRT